MAGHRVVSHTRRSGGEWTCESGDGVPGFKRISERSKTPRNGCPLSGMGPGWTFRVGNASDSNLLVLDFDGSEWAAAAGWAALAVAATAAFATPGMAVGT